MKKKLKIAFIAVGAVLIFAGAGGFIVYNLLFGSPKTFVKEEQFIIPLNQPEESAIQKLREQGFIKSERGFNFVLSKKKLRGKIQSGGYKISKSMTAWQLADAIKEPYMKWVVIPEGLRKEQIAEILAKEMGWDEQKKIDWITKHTATSWDYFEGVYFPDTYLIPKDETGLQIAQRFINKFNEKFTPYNSKFLKANIKWDTALKIASIVQREAAGKDDMPLIAGIIWNRLLKDMKLEIDATAQYARDSELAFDDLCDKPENREQWQCKCGEEDKDCYAPRGFYKGIEAWWKPIALADMKIDSKYNTYLYKGLPPYPISNPGLDAIDAALNSSKTECLYYLHDLSGQIHCSKTYEDHQRNIIKYLQQ